MTRPVLAIAVGFALLAGVARDALAGRARPGIMRQRFAALVHGDPRQLDKAALDELAQRKVGRYLSGRDPEKGLAQLDGDVRLYVWNLGKTMTGRPGGLARDAALLREWQKVKDALVTSSREGATLSKVARAKTIEQYVLELHRRVVDPRKSDPLSARLKRGSMGTLRLGGRLAKGARTFVAGALVMSFGLGLFGPFVNAPINRVTTPIVQTFDAKANYYLGDVTIAVQKLMTRLDMKLSDLERRDTVAGVQRAVGDFTRIADKFEIGQLSPEAARKLWSESEAALLLLGKNVNAIATGVFKDARGNHRELVYVQLWFGTYGETVYNGMRDRQRDLRQLEEQWAGRPMNAEARTEKVRLQQEILAAQERLGTVLAQWRVNQILYPEYTKLASVGNADHAALLKTFDTMMEGMRLDIYFQAAIDHYKKQMEILGIPPGAQQMDHVGR